MEQIIDIASQVLFAASALVFVVYSIIAIYSFNVYGRSKTVTTSISIVYSAIVSAILVWSFIVVLKIQ